MRPEKGTLRDRSGRRVGRKGDRVERKIGEMDENGVRKIFIEGKVYR